MNYLLDTGVVSELIKKAPDPRVVQWIDTVEEDKLYLSVITIGELEKGISGLKPSKRKQAIHAWLHEDLMIRFDRRILNLDAETMIVWGQMTGLLEVRGLKMPAVDSLIAATAGTNGCCLVTRNVQDFKNSGISLFNPWQ
ncbi:type II toxin-antitoxin system VapC family toxin [bacterium]|nr:type II toxin-antitoxin system VapC family toxin [bacterium]